MDKNYIKLTDIQLSQKDIETLEKIQKQCAPLFASYRKQLLKTKQILKPAIPQIAKFQEQIKPTILFLKQNEEQWRHIAFVINQHKEKLIPVYRTIANTLNNLDISQNPDILQEPASNFFDEKFLEEFSHSFGALRNEVTVPIVNEELEAIFDKPTKKLTVENIYSLFNVYLVIIGIITGTKELYEIFTETDTPQVIEYRSTEQNNFKIDELNININICPSLSSNQNSNELNGDENRTNSEIND